jgi:hypothetical protein
MHPHFYPTTFWRILTKIELTEYRRVVFPLKNFYTTNIWSIPFYVVTLQREFK